MKNKLMLLLFIFLTLPACAISEPIVIKEHSYKPDMIKCDNAFQENISKNSSDANMADAADIQIVCYEKIGHKIIDAYYKNQASDMKKSLRDTIDAFHITSKQMHNPDECYGKCGSIATLSAYSSTLEFIKLYIKEISISSQANW